MSIATRTVRIALLLGLGLPLPAHPGHGAGGFASGALHPLTGVDHLLAMVAVGLLAVRLGGRALWALPLAFLGSMLLGGIAAQLGVPMPYAEWGIAASVLVFGLLVAIARAPAPLLAASVISLGGLLHGHAHAAEMAANQAFLLYACGFLLVTALLHSAGILGGVALQRLRASGLIRVSGAVIAAASVVLAVQLLRA